MVSYLVILLIDEYGLAKNQRRIEHKNNRVGTSDQSLLFIDAFIDSLIACLRAESSSQIAVKLQSIKAI